jgi:hypothetical protein
MFACCSAVLHTQPLSIGVLKSAAFVHTTASGMTIGTLKVAEATWRSTLSRNINYHRRMLPLRIICRADYVINSLISSSYHAVGSRL